MSPRGTKHPHEIAVVSERGEMRIIWEDGRTSRISAAALRSACRCGWCTRDKVLGRPKVEASQVLIQDLTILGSHGLHVRFSDGHERGIFPWAYLEELAGASSAHVLQTPTILAGALA